MQATILDNLTLEEYLKFEEKSDIKYEYHDGQIIGRIDSMINHSRISGNIQGCIYNNLKRQNATCEIFNSNVKLHIQKENRYVYPDGMVICGDIQTSEDYSEAITNPILIIEVLSKSTADYDRGDKFFFYQQIESLQEYILIEQEKMQIDIYSRRKNLWKISRVTATDKSLYLSCLEMTIDLKNIYRKVVFEKL